MNLAKLFTRHIVYVDETGFNLHTCRSKSRAAKEEFAKLTLVPKQKRLTIIAALDRTGFFHYRLVNSTTDKHGTNAEDFRNFLMDLFFEVTSQFGYYFGQLSHSSCRKFRSNLDHGKNKFWY